MLCRFQENSNQNWNNLPCVVIEEVKRSLNRSTIIFFYLPQFSYGFSKIQNIFSLHTRRWFFYQRFGDRPFNCRVFAWNQSKKRDTKWRFSHCIAFLLLRIDICILMLDIFLTGLGHPISCKYFQYASLGMMKVKNHNEKSAGFGDFDHVQP